MADTRPTKLKFYKIIYLCFLAIFNPKKFIEEEKKDNEVRKNFPPAKDKEDRIYAVRRALWRSFRLLILSALFGGSIGLFLHYCCSQSPPFMIIILQVVGAGLLLWGTLFVRGWEIRSWCGIMLTERVNQWIYRFLYCLGTGIIICSLIWTPGTDKYIIDSNPQDKTCGLTDLNKEKVKGTDESDERVLREVSEPNGARPAHRMEGNRVERVSRRTAILIR